MHNVLFLSPYSFTGGGQRWLQTLVNYLPEYGIKPYVIFNRGHRAHYFYRKLHDHIIHEACFLWNSIKYAETIAETIKTFRIKTLVIEHDEKIQDILKYCRKKPDIVFVDHTMDLSTVEELHRIDSLVDAVVAVSHAVAENIDWRPVTVIWDAVPPPPAMGLDVRKLMGIPPDAKVVGYVGRIDPNKNVNVIIEVAERAGYWSLIVGSGPILPKLRKNAPDTCRFMPVDVWFVGDWYKAMDAFVLASTLEGFGLSPLEALHYDVPVYMTPVSDYKMIFGDTIKFFDHGDIDGLAELLKQPLYDPTPAKQIMLEKLSVEGMVEAYANLFKG